MDESMDNSVDEKSEKYDCLNIYEMKNLIRK